MTADEVVRASTKRWVVEQTFGTLMLHRRLVRDHETPPAGGVSMIYWLTEGSQNAH